MERVVKVSDLADLVEATIDQIQRAVFRERAKGIIAELPDAVQFDVVIVDDAGTVTQFLEGTTTQTPGTDTTEQSTLAEAVSTETTTRNNNDTQATRTDEGGSDQDTTTTDYSTFE